MLDDITASADTPQVNSEFVTRLTSAYMQAVSETKASPMDGLQAIANLIILLLANVDSTAREWLASELKRGLPELTRHAANLAARSSHFGHRGHA
jgi:hypothetical protein